MKTIEGIMNEWNALQPLSERDKEMLSRRFTIDFNYNSNHIEGNTLTLDRQKSCCFSARLSARQKYVMYKR